MTTFYQISFHNDIPAELLAKYREMEVGYLRFNTSDELINYCIKNEIKHVKIVKCKMKHG